MDTMDTIIQLNKKIDQLDGIIYRQEKHINTIQHNFEIAKQEYVKNLISQYALISMALISLLVHVINTL